MSIRSAYSSSVRWLDRVTFANDAEFREAYFKAVPEAVEFTFVGR